ncbi:uncharacterized protein LOC121265563 [Juglans microcarpa x Juglans regia]|uniref:uncharacterized protein LOC121265563 n=1 Tax=Juglans microcarpa x Juglans regia TaxID=2249226 RepID=UPI001B7E59DF|nr:uncharacterized protein LOC121265563 [Juglans microcarpa x Juglans regia]
MGNFCGFHNLGMFILFIFFSTPARSVATRENPLFELSSREELVQIAGYGEERLSTVLVTGSILCEACVHGDPHIRVWPISGAMVAVNCHKHGRKCRSGLAQGVTDEFGDFIIDLPSHLHSIPNLEKTCSIKVLRIPKNSPCRPTSVRKQKGIILSSVGNSIRSYSAGSIRFLHLTSRPLQACVKGGGHKEMLW